MSTTLTNGSTVVTLSDDLHWSDEFDWNPVEQSADRTITGALVVTSAVRTGGRPLTLESDDSSAWHSRNTIEQLRNWAAVPGLTMTLLYRGVTRTVMFRAQDGVAVEASPIVRFADVQGTDWYRLVLRLMEIPS